MARVGNRTTVSTRGTIFLRRKVALFYFAGCPGPGYLHIFLLSDKLFSIILSDFTIKNYSFLSCP